MKTETEVRAMLSALTDRYETIATMDGDVEAVYDTLLWFLGDRTDTDVKLYFTDI